MCAYMNPKTCTRTLTAAQFARAKYWRKTMSLNSRTDKSIVVYSYKEYYIAMKTNYLLIHVPTRVKLTNASLNKRNQMQKNVYHNDTTCRIFNKKWNKSMVLELTTGRVTFGKWWYLLVIRRQQRGLEILAIW